MKRSAKLLHVINNWYFIKHINEFEKKETFSQFFLFLVLCLENLFILFVNYTNSDFKHHKSACQSHISKLADQIKHVAHTSVKNHQLKEEAIKWRRFSGQLSCIINQDGLGPTGGWCLQPSGEDWGELGISALHHVPADNGIAGAIMKFLNNDHKVTILVDIGAGVGQYGFWFKAKKANIQWIGYDGAENVDEFTGGFVQWTDATNLVFDNIQEKGDWVMSLEVGEHIPPETTLDFISTLDRHNKVGIILSWGVPVLSGHSHINLKTNEEVIQLLDDHGYYQDKWCLEFQNFGRLEADYGWFKNSFMVFKRKNVNHTII